ncbi:cell wall-binding repeat-containing protein [Rathayibacter sp. VKM Ac-2857]|uniref:cell wall-binding repeat-containing protein n=1 Tax=Rathayibacter sp. VKM Ac-2857 TaxID=2739020 RepID=UPI001563416C|nr:cell wall-binding repeat-containing protein [Rathayibacter sp. VKM Ac-2857]NQX14679.1 cell wall-binding repeat-containing protein [Rathayibacter sp. VKM Ac-2857]
MTLRPLTSALTALLLVLAGIGAADPAAAAQEAATLTVVPHYVDAAGNPATTIGRARMELHVGDSDGAGALGHAHGTGITGSDAGWTFHGLEAGPYAVRVDPRGWAPTWFGDTSFTSAAGVIVLAPGEERTVDVVVRPGAVVSGTVTSGGVVEAYLRDPATGELELMNSSDGVANAEDSYHVDFLPAGEYLLHGTGLASDRFVENGFWRDSRTVAGADVLAVATGSTTTGIDVVLSGWAPSTDRIAGSDRYSTAVAVSRSAFRGRVPVVYLASGEVWPDALSAGPAAAVQHGALLLTDPRALPAAVEDEIRRLSPERIVVVGSVLSVSAAVEARLSGLAPVVDRLGGADRYETSRLVVADAFAGREVEYAYLATGANYPDALTVGPVAGAHGDPVLLVDGARPALDPPTLAGLDSLSAAHVRVIGSEAAVSRGITDQLLSERPELGTYRVAGADRIATGIAVNELEPPDRFGYQAYLARADGFADALGAIAAAAAQHRPIQLTDSSCVRSATFAALRRAGTDSLTLLGGTGTLSEDVAALEVCS